MTWTTYYSWFNKAPVAKDDTGITAYNTPLVINVLANDYDPNGDRLSVTSATASHGSVRINDDGSLTFTPDPDYHGPAEICYTISDGRGGTDSAIARISVSEPTSDGIVSGTDGDDLIDVNYTGDPDGDRVDNNDAHIWGTTGNQDVIKAGAGNDTIYAGAGNDSVWGGDGDDYIDGGAGNDYLSGGAGNDTLVSGAETDHLSGGSGLDMADYSASSSGVNVNLMDQKGYAGDAKGDTYEGIDGVYGSAHNDTLIGFDIESKSGADQFTNVFHGGDGDDYIDGRGGDDSLYGDAGNDTIIGGSGNDYIEGGAGNDTLYGDGETVQVQAASLTLDWQRFMDDGKFTNGESIDMGGVSAKFDFHSQDYGATASISNDLLYTKSGDGLSNSTGLKLYGKGGSSTGGVENTSTSTITFSSNDATMKDVVTDVTFRINDIDLGNSSDYHEDIVTVRAYDASGKLLAVQYTPEGNQYVSGNTVKGGDKDYGDLGPDDQKGSVLVKISGQVARIEIDYDNGGPTDQSIWITDINAKSVPVAGEKIVPGNDTILGGDGDDVIYGNGGNDLLDGGAGADRIYGGDDADTIRGGAGDVIDGGAGGHDWDTLDLTGQGAYRLVDVTEDSNGNGTDGTVEFLDAEGKVTGSLKYTEIEEIVGDGINLDPNAMDDTAETDEDTPVTIDVLANDVDPEGAALSVTDASSDQGEVTINPDGTITFNPAENFNGEATITYTVSDGNGGTDTATVTVTVNPVNDDPVAMDDAASTAYATAVTVDVLANDTDVDGDTLTVTGATSDQGSVTINADGTLTFTPATGFSGEATVNYTVSDGNGGTDSATLTVTVAERPLDGIVSGTDGDDLIDANYTGDPDGDMVDNNDAILPGEFGDDDIIKAGAGNDTVRAGNGDDEIYGGAGDDDIDGQAGDDEIHGEDGDDSIQGGAGNDTIYGGAGNDTLRGGAGQDEIHGGDGNDSIFGGSENDTLYGDAGNDTLQGNDGDDLLIGGDGDDSANGGIGNDTLYGDAGNDSLDGGAGDDVLFGGDGDDVLKGGAGDDELYGEAGHDSITGGTGDDLLDGGDGNDTLIGNEGNDTLLGGAGNDSIIGGAGSDYVEGGDGDDYIDTSNGEIRPDQGYPGLFPSDSDPYNDRDTVYGGAGNDTIITGDDADYIEGGDGDDVIDGGIDNDTIYGGDGHDYIVGGEGADYIEGGAGNDTIYAGNAPEFPDALNIPDDIDLLPENGTDTVYGGDGDDLIFGADDADLLYGDAGNDTIHGGIDNDSIYGGDGDDELHGDEGDDYISGGEGNDTLYGGAGNDTLDAGQGGDELHGGDGDDLLLGGPGPDVMYGDAGDDTLEGGSGDDELYGGEGDDSIHGWFGNDIIDGGPGADTLYGDAGNDTITSDADDLVSGGEGDDVLNAAGGTVSGDAGNDTFNIDISMDDGTYSGGDDRDTFNILAHSDDPAGYTTIDGGEGGDDYDVLDLTGQGNVIIRYDEDNVENGTVTFLRDGNPAFPTSTIRFTNIEKVIADGVIPCFTPGTLVATPKGERLVEDLVEGDRIITRDNGIQTIRWVGRRDMTRAELAAAPHLKPVMIRAGSLGPNLPERDMLVSPNHRMLVANERTALFFEEHEVLVAAKHLVDNRGVKPVDTLGTSYIHFMFDRHEVVLANGAWTESFQPGDMTLGSMGNAQRSEIFEIFPELQSNKGIDDYRAARRTLKRHEAALLVGR